MLKPRFSNVVHGWSWGCGDCGATVYADANLKSSCLCICPVCGSLPKEERPVQHDDFAVVDGWDMPKATTYTVNLTPHQRVGMALAISGGNDVKVVIEADGTIALAFTAPVSLADGLGLRTPGEGEPPC